MVGYRKGDEITSRCYKSMSDISREFKDQWNYHRTKWLSQNGRRIGDIAKYLSKSIGHKASQSIFHTLKEEPACHAPSPVWS